MELEKTDQEQVEQLQQWWRENRLALIVGLAVGIGGLVGWEQWQRSSESRSMQASVMFEDVSRAVAVENADRADTALAALQEAYPGSVYVVEALAMRAALAAKSDDWAAAEEYLQQALNSGPEPVLAGMLRLRLARAQWAGGNAENALSTLDKAIPEAYSGSREELRGDIEYARGNLEAARAAWEKALPMLAGSPAVDALNAKLARVGGSS
ncbi:MAG: tetratricopeptide repeat protein [Oceanococcaceae bacterium]